MHLMRWKESQTGCPAFRSKLIGSKLIVIGAERIHQRAPAARTYRVCIRKLSPITPTGRTNAVRPVGVYIAQSAAFLFVGIQKMPTAEAACVMKNSTHTMPYLHPSTRWTLIIFLAPAETVHIDLMLCRLRFSVRSALQSAHWCGRYFDKRASD